MRYLITGLGVFCLLFALTSVGVTLVDSAKRPGEPFLNRLAGTWKGEGKTLGAPSRVSVKTEWVLSEEFLRLALKIDMSDAKNQNRIFEGHAYYHPVGENKYEGYWFDSRGVSFPIKAHAEGDTLTAFWGTPQTEQGRSTYRLVQPDRLEIEDSTLGKDGTWKEFGSFKLRKE